MRQRIFIVVMVLVAVVLIAAIAALTLLPKPSEGPSPGAGPNTGNPGEQTQELDPFCPSRLQVSTFVVTQDTMDKSDDEVWLSIVNPDPRDYSAKIFVNLEFETGGIIPADSKLELKSEQMTEWWISPAAANPDAEVETIDIAQVNTFTIDVRVKDCEKQISLLTPDSPIPAYETTGSGGGEGGGSGGAGGGGGGGSTIKIVRPVNQNLND